MAYWRLRHTRLTWSGVAHAQAQGPVLVLANHSNILDPAMLVAAFSKPIHFLAADTAMQEPFEGRVSRFFGSIPKRKFAIDMNAIRMIRQWAQLGASIGLFPEGERSWNLEPLPFVPGIERLVRMVKLPVVTAKILNAGRVWPRWAPRPRRGHVHIEFSAPRAFERNDSDTTILNHIYAGLRITPEEHARYPVQGNDLAKGLSNALYACPHCHRFNALQERRNAVTCGACLNTWHLDTSLRLHGSGGSIHLADAMSKAKSHLARGQGPLAAGEGKLLETSGVTFRERSSKEPVNHGLGTLTLFRDRATFSGKAQIDVPIEGIQTCSLDLRRKLILREGARSFEAHIPNESALLWAHTLEQLLTPQTKT